MRLSVDIRGDAESAMILNFVDSIGFRGAPILPLGAILIIVFSSLITLGVGCLWNTSQAVVFVLLKIIVPIEDYLQKARDFQRSSNY